QPQTTGLDISFGGTPDSNGLHFEADEIDMLQSNVSKVVIGNSNGNNAIFFNEDITFTSELELSSSEITLNDSVVSTSGNSLTIDQPENIEIGGPGSGSFKTDSGDIVLQGPAINVAPEILLNSSSVTGTGGAIRITATEASVEVGDLNSSGDSGGPVEVGAVTDITAGVINSGGIDNETSEGGDITVISDSDGAIVTGDLDSSGADAGGDIWLQSDGAIVTEDLDSSGADAGGDITIISGNAITTEEIDSSSISGDGGDVLLDPPGDVIVEYINAQGGSNGSGGDVTVETERFFQATGSFPVFMGNILTLASISTASGSVNEGGSIEITHGGGALEVPFVVGTLTENGTAGAIVSGSSNSIAPESNELLSFPDSYFQVDNSPATRSEASSTQGGISLITDDLSSLLDDTLGFDASIFQEQPISVLSPQFEFSPEIVQIVEQVEESLTREYENHFGRPAETEIKSLVQIQNELLQVQQATRVRPALIYTFFFAPDVNVEELVQRIDSYGQEAIDVFNQVAVPNQTPSDSEEWQYNAYSLSDDFSSEAFNVRDYIAAQDDQEAQLVVLMVTSQGQPVLRSTGATRRSANQQARILGAGIQREFITTAATQPWEASANQLYQWIIQPLEEELENRSINNLVFIPDTLFRSVPFGSLQERAVESSTFDSQTDEVFDANFLPVAALKSNDGRFLIEDYSLGLMPSVSLTDTRYSEIRFATALIFGINEFSNLGLPDLNHVNDEAAIIKAFRQGSEQFLNEQATIQELEELLSQGQDQNSPQRVHKIIHFATHSAFDEGSPENSYIQLFDGRLTLEDFQSDELNFRNLEYPIELMVLSACQTALGNREAELGFAGFAFHAGVKSVLASLANVPDAETAELISLFYYFLEGLDGSDLDGDTSILDIAQTSEPEEDGLIFRYVEDEEGEPPILSLEYTEGYDPNNVESFITKSEALQSAQLQMLYAPELEHPYNWAWFTIVGNPW
ncbi:MAG: CHAT domain-containing protein, partial [Cyanobacteria bacterium P01_D01_bin.56]